ncbi:MAG: hypothetical protein ACK4IK_11225 [Bacteroidia bacterium]
MKLKVILILFCVLTFQKIIAQEFYIDNRLFDVYTLQYIEELKSKNIDQLLYLNYFLDHGWYIDKLPKEKLTTIQSLKLLINTDIHSETELSEILSDSNRYKEFNILKYQIIRNAKGNTVYKINDDGLVLIIYGNDQLMQAFNSYRNKFIEK